MFGRKAKRIQQLEERLTSTQATLMHAEDSVRRRRKCQTISEEIYTEEISKLRANLAESLGREWELEKVNGHIIQQAGEWKAKALEKGLPTATQIDLLQSWARKYGHYAHPSSGMPESLISTIRQSVTGVQMAVYLLKVWQRGQHAGEGALPHHLQEQFRNEVRYAQGRRTVVASEASTTPVEQES